jgi:K+-sensing histidine kinase KdpD
MIRQAMADVPQTDGGVDGAPDRGYLQHVCHQLRQPLVVAVGYVSMLEEGSFGQLPAEATPVLRTIAERLDAMNAIIDRLADGEMPASEG